LGRAYQASASHYFYHRRNYQEALKLASKAAEYGETRVLARLKNSWRYRVPIWLIPLGDMVFDLLKKMGFFQG
jgi:TPR repeat protein